MSRKTSPDAMSVQIAVRVPPRLVEALDLLARRLRDDSPGAHVTRADAARRAMLRGLAAMRQKGQAGA